MVIARAKKTSDGRTVVLYKDNIKHKYVVKNFSDTKFEESGFECESTFWDEANNVYNSISNNKT